LSDRGIQMLRTRLHDDLEAIGRGDDPKAVIRDPEINKAINLPIADRDVLVEGMTLAQMQAHPIYSKHLQRFMFQAGQPAKVWDAYCEAMGLGRRDAVDDRKVIEI